MQKTFRVSGDLSDLYNLEKLEELFSSSGLEFCLEDEENLYLTNDTVDLHIYGSMIGILSDNCYLVGGTIEGDFETVDKFLREVASLLESRNILYDLNFYEDCDGEPPEEYRITHPNFYES
jgi:hypothetical protein